MSDEMKIIPDLQTLESIFCENDLLGIEIRHCSNKIERVIISCSVERFIEYLKRRNISTIFYKYYYYNIDEYLIDDELLESYELAKDETEEIIKKIQKYNDEIAENFDFNKPKLLLLATPPESNILTCMYVSDPWLAPDEETGEEKINTSPEAALDKMIYPHEDDLKKRIVDKNAKNQYIKASFKKKLFTFLVNDSKFSLCSNKTLRREYLHNFKEYQPELTLTPKQWGREWNPYGYRSFFEITWKLKKQGHITYTEDIGKLLNVY